MSTQVVSPKSLENRQVRRRMQGPKVQAHRQASSLSSDTSDQPPLARNAACRRRPSAWCW